LITITIISILAGLILGVAAVAGEKARENNSRHVVARLHTLLSEFYSTYKTRRVRLSPAMEAGINNQFANNPARRGQALAEARLYALREMMLLELPDRWSDVSLEDIGTFDPSDPKKPVYLAGRTDWSNVYVRRLASVLNRNNTLTGQQNTEDEILANQSAECLYLIITLATGDGEARSQFAESSIQDTDGDGAPEFVDGWGHPIRFLRWPAGFDSQIQINVNQFSGPNDPDWQLAAAGDHDPFDVYRVNTHSFRLVPLIYSAGRDEEYGIYDGSNYDPIWEAGVGIRFFDQPPRIRPPLNPYAKPGGSITVGTVDEYIGTALDETATDDIHNHLLGLR
jgi:type II secretory pathway pseudopilin PulG